MTDDLRRVCIISFDFKQQKGANQTRKTRFFRELYGYTQQVKQKLKDGEVIFRTYHYPGVLDQIPYIKLGRSVLAVKPDNEKSIIQLLRAFDEVVFYTFIGWLPMSIWSIKDEPETSIINNLIASYGYLSILVHLQRHGAQDSTTSTLLDEGFDSSYLNRAVQYLTDSNLLVETSGKLSLTSKAQKLVSHVL